MTATTGPASSARRRLRGAALCLIYAVPLVGSVGLVVLVSGFYMECSGSAVIAATKRLSQLLWLLGMPVLSYCVIGLILIRWRSKAVSAHALRTLAATGVVGLLYLYFNARYFSLTQAGCVDGLPRYWPSWLPAR